MTYGKVRKILENNGFTLKRHKSASHRRYTGEVSGQTQHVTLAYARESEDVIPGTLAAIIRQSGLDKKLFR